MKNNVLVLFLALVSLSAFGQSTGNSLPANFNIVGVWVGSTQASFDPNSTKILNYITNSNLLALGFKEDGTGYVLVNQQTRIPSSYVLDDALLTITVNGKPLPQYDVVYVDDNTFVLRNFTNGRESITSFKRYIQ